MTVADSCGRSPDEEGSRQEEGGGGKLIKREQQEPASASKDKETRGQMAKQGTMRETRGH